MKILEGEDFKNEVIQGNFRGVRNCTFESCVILVPFIKGTLERCTFKNCSFRVPICVYELFHCNFYDCNGVVKFIEQTYTASYRCRNLKIVNSGLSLKEWKRFGGLEKLSKKFQSSLESFKKVSSHEKNLETFSRYLDIYWDENERAAYFRIGLAKKWKQNWWLEKRM